MNGKTETTKPALPAPAPVKVASLPVVAAPAPAPVAAPVAKPVSLTNRDLALLWFAADTAEKKRAVVQQHPKLKELYAEARNLN